MTVGRFYEDKNELLVRYRFAAEQALERAGLLTTQEVVAHLLYSCRASSKETHALSGCLPEMLYALRKPLGSIATDPFSHCPPPKRKCGAACGGKSVCLICRCQMFTARSLQSYQIVSTPNFLLTLTTLILVKRTPRCNHQE